MKKNIIKLALAILTCVAFSSCTKVVVANYKFNVDDVKYVEGQEATVTEFVNDLNAVLKKLNGTAFTDAKIISETQKVINKYDNGVLTGNLLLQKMGDTDSEFRTIHTFTLHHNSKYDTKAAAGCLVQVVLQAE